MSTERQATLAGLSDGRPTLVPLPAGKRGEGPTAERVQGIGPPGRDSERAKIVRLAQEFEAMLMLQMLRQMRQSMLTPGDDGEGTGGLGADVMTDTLDVELARKLSEQRGVGLAPVLVKAFDRRGPAARVETAPAPIAPAPAVSPAAQPRAAAPAADGANDIRPQFAPVGSDAHLTSRFGWRVDPFTGRSRFHHGADVKAAYGTDVAAPAAGRVVFAGERRGYGNLVEIEHEPGVRSRYAHLSATLVREGQAVGAGQVLGRVGATGRATGPHLHVELIVNGSRVDPAETPRFAAAGLGRETPVSSLLKKVGEVVDFPSSRSSSQPVLGADE